MIKIGITGTRNPINEIQKENVYNFLSENYSELHHGDCQGADVEVAYLAHGLSHQIICHPPLINELRGFFPYNNEIREPKSYFARNRNIVDETHILLVVPKDNSPQPIGGTWYTYNYAKKKNKPLIIFYPDGRLSSLNYIKDENLND